MKDDTIIIENAGDIVNRTNYFDTSQAGRGEFYLTWNAGCGRLLVPDLMKHYVSEMRCKFVEVIKMEDRITIIFDDESDAPFSLQLALEQNDRDIEKGDCEFCVYVRLEEKYRFPCLCKIDKSIKPETK